MIELYFKQYFDSARVVFSDNQIEDPGPNLMTTDADRVMITHEELHLNGTRK